MCGISLLRLVWAKWVIIGSVNLKTACNSSECPDCSAAVFLSISSCFYWLLHQCVCQNKSSCWFTGFCVACRVYKCLSAEQWREKVNLFEMCISGEWISQFSSFYNHAVLKSHMYLLRLLINMVFIHLSSFYLVIRCKMCPEWLNSKAGWIVQRAVALSDGLPSKAFTVFLDCLYGREVTEEAVWSRDRRILSLDDYDLSVFFLCPVADENALILKYTTLALMQSNLCGLWSVIWLVN